VGFYGGVLLALSVYITILFSLLVLALLIKKTIKPMPNPLIMEVPSYRKPLFKNVVSKGWIRMRDFVYIVMPLLVAGGAFYGFMVEIGFVKNIIGAFNPLTVGWLGLPPETVIPLVYGFIQKDLTVGMLVAVLGPNLNEFLTPLQLYTFGIASSIQIPCIIAFWMLIHEFGFKKAILLTILSLAYGLFFAGIIWRLISWIFLS
jgi:ferrous iron transport protein B